MVDLYNNKIINVVAGLNGCGKTTFASAYLVQKSQNYLNPDLIAQGLGDNFNKASFQAGKILLLDIKNKIKNAESFSFESTLSGLTYLSILESAKLNEYKIIIYYLTLDKIEINTERIQNRVKQGGHFITKEVLERRATKCALNFWTKYRLLANEWYILNNSTSKPKLIMSHESFEILNFDNKKSFEESFLGTIHD